MARSTTENPETTPSADVEVSEANVETPVEPGKFETVELVNRLGEKRTATTVSEKVALEFNGFTTNPDRFKKSSK